MGERIVVMKDGVIQQVASPGEVYASPLNIFVAGFIGSPAMNFLRGSLSENGSDVIFSAYGAEWKLTAAQAQKLRERGYVGKEAVLGIRPENILYGCADAANTFEATIDVVEYTGSEAYLHCSGFGDKMLTIRAAAGKAKRGELATLAVDIEKAHFFDAETEKNILLSD